MHVFFLSSHQKMAENLRSVLSKSNISVTHARSIDQARRLLRAAPDVFFVDYYVLSQSGIEITKTLKQEGLLEGSEVWLTGYGIANSKKELMKIAGNRYWPQPLNFFDIQDFLESRQDDQRKVISPTAARMIGQVWASKSTAILAAEGIRLIFANGALIREDPPNCFEEALEDGDFSYSVVQNLTGGDWNKTGKRLIKACSGGDISHWLEDHHRSAFGYVFSLDLNELELDKDMLSFVSSRTALRKVSLSTKAIGQLYVLWLLGLVRGETAVERQRQQQSVDLEARVRKNQNYSWILAEYARLKTAEPFVVLGIPAKADSKIIVESVARMRERYTAIQHADRVSDEIKTAAQNMLTLIDQAAKSVHADAIDENMAEEQKLLMYAKRMMAQSNWVQAKKALTKAHQIRIEDVDILANLGWVQYQTDSSQMDEAIENLHLALHLESSHLDSLVFLSRIYIEKEDYESAMPFLRKATTLTPDPEIQEMRKLAEAEIKILERNRNDN